MAPYWHHSKCQIAPGGGDGRASDGLATTVVGLRRGVAFASMLDPTVGLHATRAEVEAFLAARFARSDVGPAEAGTATPRGPRR